MFYTPSWRRQCIDWDLVSLEELKKLAAGSVEAVRVKRILGRMES
jgi:hypothetical protein